MINVTDVSVIPFTQALVDEYMEYDWVNDLMVPKKNEISYSDSFICNQWLLADPVRRMIFSHIYGDLFRGPMKKLKILDIGAGVNFSQRVLAKRHNLSIIDILVHDNKADSHKFFKENEIQHFEDDWFNIIDDIEPVDIIIVNDLIPNADQRLPEFLTKIKGKCKELRLMLTHYSNGLSQKVVRVLGDEIMFLRAWTGKNIVDTLSDHIQSVPEDALYMLENNSHTLFKNGRHCCLLKLKINER